MGGSADDEGVAGEAAAEDLATVCLKQLAAAVMRAFARHITLVRPLGESGKLRLAADMAHFELALEPLLAAAKGPSKLKLSDLGQAYGELRSLRQLLFVEVSERMGSRASWIALQPMGGDADVHPTPPFLPYFLHSPWLPRSNAPPLERGLIDAP